MNSSTSPAILTLVVRQFEFNSKVETSISFEKSRMLADVKEFQLYSEASISTQILGPDWTIFEAWGPSH